MVLYWLPLGFFNILNILQQIFTSWPAPLWVSLSLVGLYLGTILALAEGLNRWKGTDAELTRKIVHIGTGNVILMAWWLDIPAWVTVGAAAIASLVALTSYFIPLLPSIDSVGRKSWGTFFYAVSIGVLVAWFWPLQQPQHAATGILVMAWGDGLAGSIGRQWGRHRYAVLGMAKSWEGSLTMAGVSFLVTSLILVAMGHDFWQTGLISLAVAGVATSLEAFSKLGIDNLTVPLASAAVSFYLSQALS